MQVDNHSKTPWIINTTDGGCMRILASDPRATIVASNLGHPDNKEAKADAMLMVNAPVMFDAIRKAIMMTDALHTDVNKANTRMRDIEKILRNAIQNIV